MAYEHQELQFTLFKNADATGNQPQFTGGIKINGIEYELAGWPKQDKNGKTFIAGKGQLPRQAQEAPPQAPPEQDEDGNIF